MSVNDRMGRAVLVGGTKLVLNDSITAVTDIWLSNNIPGGTVGALYISARNVDPMTPPLSFTISSTSGADTSTVAWWMIEPATVDPLSNPPSLTPMVKVAESNNLPPALKGIRINSGVSDDWLKWQQQITKGLNAVMDFLGISPNE